MLRIYYSLILKRAGRICRELGVVVVLLLAFVCLMLYGFRCLEARYQVAVFAMIALGVVQARDDRAFLRTMFGKRYKWLLVSDTLLLALPFVVLMVMSGDWLMSVVCLLIGVGIPFLPKYSSGFSIPGCRLFPKGNYEFQKGMRTFLIPYCILLAVSVIGMDIW